MWGDRIPMGVLYQDERPIYEDQEVALSNGPLAKRELEALTPEQVQRLKAEFL